MTITFRYLVPVKVKPKGRPRFNGRIAYTDKTTRDFERDVKNIVKNLFELDQPLSTPLYVKIEIFFTRPKKPTHKYPSRGDCDNLFKSVADACNGILWNDDSQIVNMSCSKSWADEDYFILTITELEL